jgi:hypothetical protein
MNVDIIMPRKLNFLKVAHLVIAGDRGPATFGVAVTAASQNGRTGDNEGQGLAHAILLSVYYHRNTLAEKTPQAGNATV